MDYMAFVEYHQASQADITIGCLPCNDERAQDFGLMKIDDAGQVIVSLASLLPGTQRPGAYVAKIVSFLLRKAASDFCVALMVYAVEGAAHILSEHHMNWRPSGRSNSHVRLTCRTSQRSRRVRH
jgi:hypothetical protein